MLLWSFKFPSISLFIFPFAVYLLKKMDLYHSFPAWVLLIVSFCCSFVLYISYKLVGGAGDLIGFRLRFDPSPLPLAQKPTSQVTCGLPSGGMWYLVVSVMLIAIDVHYVNSLKRCKSSNSLMLSLLAHLLAEVFLYRETASSTISLPGGRVFGCFLKGLKTSASFPFIDQFSE